MVLDGNYNGFDEAYHNAYQDWNPHMDDYETILFNNVQNFLPQRSLGGSE